jgi:hypothetical protein
MDCQEKYTDCSSEWQLKKRLLLQASRNRDACRQNDKVTSPDFDLNFLN